MFNGKKAEIPEMRLALFGESGSGKTTLMSSYYGNQLRSGWEDNHGYTLEACSPSQSAELIERYNRLEDGSFPDGTNIFKEYLFDFKISGLRGLDPSMRIVWYDYPGGWWIHGAQDAGERESRLEAFSKLLNCHVAFLLIDGQSFARRGGAELKRQLEVFGVELKRLLDDLIKAGNPVTEFPKNWVIAFSKSDLFGAEVSASDLGRQLRHEAADQLQTIQRILGDETNFGQEFLLLSAVQGSNGGVVNAHKSMGLQLLAPVAFASTLRMQAEKASKGRISGGLSALFSVLRKSVEKIDALDNYLPLKYQFLTLVLKSLPLEDWSGKAEGHFREKQIAAAKKGKGTEALVNGFVAELKSEAAKREYGKWWE